jgi:hypothetical protein
MKHQKPRKILEHEVDRPKQRKTASAAQSHTDQLPFDVERWKADWQRVKVADQQIKEARAALKTHSQNKEMLAALRLAVSDKFDILRQMYVYQRHIPPDKNSTDSWWSVAPAYELLRGGDVAELETIMRFLEIDPWFHGSGYLKENVITAIKPWMLSADDAKRLQYVCLSIVDRRDGREFRAFCSLARKVDAPELREALTQRLTHSDPHVRRRARWMLDALEVVA